MLLIGVGIFCATMYRGASLSFIMFDHVFYLKLPWIEAIQMIFVIIAVSMTALGFMILFVGCLATGETIIQIFYLHSTFNSIQCVIYDFRCYPSQNLQSMGFTCWWTNIVRSFHGHHIHSENHMDSDLLFPGHCDICFHVVLENVFKD